MERIASARTETNPLLLKNLYRTYYAERFKTVRVIMLVIAIALFFAAAVIYYNGFGIMWAAALAWVGLILIIYPINAYRKPYKSVKNTKTVTRFDFYEDYISENANGKPEKFRYGDIYKTLETNLYFYIFHTSDSVSVVEKKDISFGSEDDLRKLLKTKTNYKRQK